MAIMCDHFIVVSNEPLRIIDANKIVSRNINRLIDHFILNMSR